MFSFHSITVKRKNKDPHMCNQDDKHARSFDDKPADSVVADATDQTVESTEETVALNELFAEAEGYTPLADVHMNALAGAMFMAMPPTVEGDTVMPFLF